jgi:DNA topoisomerase I
LIANRISKPFTLVICEKFDSATRIARALGKDNVRIVFLDGIKFLEVFSDKGLHYIICSAIGHLYGLVDITKGFNIYPTFDIDWAPVYSKRRQLKRLRLLIKTISEISKSATNFIHACDYDQEGEVIGFNILEYACKRKYDKCFRAKFSTLTDEEIRSSFDNLLSPDRRLAEAGRCRHVIDFLYGVNLSRALLYSFRAKSKDRFRNMSIGRVQGPTLAFVVRKEIEIKEHIPVPYWVLSATFKKNEQIVKASYIKEKVPTLTEANSIFNYCIGKTGLVKEMMADKVQVSPPSPFNIGDLQREAYRLFSISPKITLSIAEKLYLNALISYPRTSSQKLPGTINYNAILSNLTQISKIYDDFARLLFSKNKSLSPTNGEEEDPAHPAIYPTGVKPKHTLNHLELSVYDLIVKRFFATFGDPFTILHTTSLIEVNDGYIFKTQGKKHLDKGWTYFYQPYFKLGETFFPNLKSHDILENDTVTILDKFTQAPVRSNPSSLLQTMARENIGTKSTRADIIDILKFRNYIYSHENGTIEATSLGIVVIELLEKYVPEIISTRFTRIMEGQLGDIEAGQDNYASVIKYAVNSLIESLILLKKNESDIGLRISNAAKLSYNK